MPSPLAQALYLTRQHYRRTVPSGVDNNRIILLGFFLIMLWRYRCCHGYITIINSIAAIFPSVFRYWRMFIRFVSVYCIIFVSILDIDECLSSLTNNCPANSNCTNNDGSYTCTCLNGFSKVGSLCRGTWFLSSVDSQFFYEAETLHF